jgi:hypothetical protein
MAERSVEVLVGQTVDFKVNLQVGSSSTRVEATGEALSVDVELVYSRSAI